MGDSETVTEKIRPGTRKHLDVTFRNDIGGCGEALEEVSYRVPPERRFTTLDANGSGYISCEESGKTVDCRWLQKSMTSGAANAVP